VLLTPETVTLLNDTGAAILRLCDGERTVAEIVTELRGRYDEVAGDEVRLFLADLIARRRLEVTASEPEAGGRHRG
jgi:pyrroloquinoline quinone biosynthesis protein D